MQKKEGIRFAYDETAVVIGTGSEAALLVGDLHIGIERRFVEKGVHLADTTGIMLERIKTLLERFGLNNLVVLGDVKDSILRPTTYEARAVHDFFSDLEGVNITVTAGNHDSNLDEITDVKILEEAFIGNYAMMHGHKWPSEKAMMCGSIFVGHNHAAVMTGSKPGPYNVQKAWLIANINERAAKKNYKSFNRKAKLVVLPAFNDLITGTPVNSVKEGHLSPLFRNKVFNYESANVYNLRGQLVGSVKAIRN